MSVKNVQKKLKQHEKAAVAFVVLALLTVVAISVFVSPLFAVGGLVGFVLVGVALLEPTWAIAVLAIYFPFEPFLMKFVPDELFLFVRFSPEILLYLLVGLVFLRLVTSGRSRPRTPIDLPFALFIVTIVASAIINLLEPTTAVIGTRQIIRFMLVFFVVIYLRPERSFIRTLTAAMMGIVVIQASVGILQFVIGERLDNFLFPSEGRFLGDITLSPNAFRFWDPGSRVFAFMGRYDRLGTFLGFFLLFGAAILYEVKTLKIRNERWIIFMLGLPALVLTYSRSGWFGFALGFLLIGWFFKKDPRVKSAVIVFALIVSSYLAYTGLVVKYLVDVPSQTVTERFFEAFSYERWRGEYYGLGRLFWIVNTPLHVIPAAPMFGHGPGTFGGGAVSALRNTGVYDELGLPFGVAGSEGYIDNNWMSLWGETGTLGLAFYAWMMIAMFIYSRRVWKESNDPFVRALALGYCGAILAVSLNAFLATFLESRTLAFYFWLYGGFVVVLGQKEGVKLLKR